MSQDVPSVDNNPYGSYLADRYLSLKLYVDAPLSSFPPPTNKFFNLKMVAKERYRRLTSNKTLKGYVAIENILSQRSTKRVVILIEGVPGVGKSTLCVHVCQEWARHHIFSEYRLVILVQLRDPEIQKASTIADLLPCRDDAMARRCADEIAASDGKDVLWVLDGWDELPVSLQTSSSFFYDMLNAPATRKSPIPLSDIIVTSRPISSASLQPIASSRYEIVGFSIEQQEEYFSDCFREEGVAADCQAFLEIVRNNPVS